LQTGASEIGKHGLELYKNGKHNNLTPLYTPSYVERLINGTN
jgi:hypothetical protein